ncbi:MAG TPA: hypothetical protein VJM32_05490 [Candidatus Saccharimonadales bacterium]|nr:hypothetical protein [Candidatus Saccharimonadales bacterium]
MADKPKDTKPADEPVKEFIEKGGRPGAGLGFNRIIKRAADESKKK